jgi:2-keto-4-pentenoate hydratase/2-oxohepta-3-ene-1,7-dioic acid hydratase in catechol pathway
MVWHTQVQDSPTRTDRLIVGQAIEKDVEVSVKVVTGNSALDYDAPFTGEIKTIDELLSPVSQAEAGTVRCVGLNYKEHAAEMKLTLPNTPTLVYMLLLLALADTVKCIPKGQHLHCICIRTHYTSLQRGL